MTEDLNLSHSGIIDKTGSAIIDEQRIQKIVRIIKPDTLRKELDSSPYHEQIRLHRKEIADVIHGRDSRVLALVGPCSIHDIESGLEYAEKLSKLSKRYEDDLKIVMRVYFEKPRTIIGWKGLINDPDLDNSFDVNKGMRVGRKFLLDVNALGLAAGTEILDLLSPQYMIDLISWGCIGARTCESQLHRELASGISCPVGFKNSTSGELDTSINALASASHKHVFLSSTREGEMGLFHSTGNPDCHIVLRGGKTGPNYGIESIDKTIEMLHNQRYKHCERVLVDVSHANSNKVYTRQPEICREIADHIAQGHQGIIGVMMESHLKAGNQEISDNLEYGVSITDPCIDFDTTEQTLDYLAKASVAKRRKIS